MEMYRGSAGTASSFHYSLLRLLSCRSVNLAGTLTTAKTTTGTHNLLFLFYQSDGDFVILEIY